MGWFLDAMSGKIPWNVPGTGIPIIPPWFRNPNMATILGAFGAELDARALQVRNGRAQAIPYAGADPARACWGDGTPIECQPNVLPVLAADRRITLYQTEPLASRRWRVSQWHQLHQERGTHFGEMDHVRPFWLPGVLPTIRIVFQDNAATPKAVWYTMAPDGTRSIHVQSPSNWNWDGQPTKRTRFWCIIYWPAGYASPIDWNRGPAWDSGPLWNGVPAAAIADIWQAIYDWKSAHSRFSGLILTTLQPTDLVPGQSVHPFDPTSTAATYSTGATTLPVGNWGSPVYTSGPNLGLRSRPSWAWFYGVDNG